MCVCLHACVCVYVFVCLIHDTVSWKDNIALMKDKVCIWSIGGMMRTGENQSTQTKACPIVTLSTSSITLIGLGSNPGFLNQRPGVNCLCHGMVYICLTDGTMIQLCFNNLSFLFGLQRSLMKTA